MRNRHSLRLQERAVYLISIHLISNLRTNGMIIIHNCQTDLINIVFLQRGKPSAAQKHLLLNRVPLWWTENTASPHSHYPARLRRHLKSVMAISESLLPLSATFACLQLHAYLVFHTTFPSISPHPQPRIDISRCIRALHEDTSSPKAKKKRRLTTWRD